MAVVAGTSSHGHETTSQICEAPIPESSSLLQEGKKFDDPVPEPFSFVKTSAKFDNTVSEPFSFLSIAPKQSQEVRRVAQRGGKVQKRVATPQGFVKKAVPN